MRLTDLRHAKVRTLDGESLGRIFEIHAEDGQITAIVCGPSGFFERLTSKEHGRSIPWEAVKRIEAKAVVVALGETTKRLSASRSRRGTRRPSARRSTR